MVMRRSEIAVGDRLYYSRHPGWDTNPAHGELAVVVDTARYRARQIGPRQTGGTRMRDIPVSPVEANRPWEKHRSGGCVLVDLYRHNGEAVGRAAVRLTDLHGGYDSTLTRVSDRHDAAWRRENAERIRRDRITRARDAAIATAAADGYAAYTPDAVPVTDRHGYVAVRVDVFRKLLRDAAAGRPADGRE